MRATGPEPAAFEKFLLQKGILKKGDLKEIKALKNDANVSLGIIAVNRGMLTADEVRRIMNAQRKSRKRFGTLAVELELLDEAQLHTILEEQARINFDAGEILVIQGKLSTRQLQKERREFNKQKKKQ